MSYSVVPCESESGSGAPSQTTEPSSSSSIGPKSTECEQIFLKLQVQKERTQIDEKTQLLISVPRLQKEFKRAEIAFPGITKRVPPKQAIELIVSYFFLKFRKTKTPPPYRNFGILTSGLTEL